MEGGIVLCHWYFLLKAYAQKRRGPILRHNIQEPEVAKIDGKPNTDQSGSAIPLNPIFGLNVSHQDV